MSDDPILPRLRAAFSGESVEEKRMFGSICFLVDGHLLVGASKHGLLVRVGKEGHAEAVGLPHVRPMQMGKRVMQGYVFVAEEGVASARDLRRWLDRARAVIAALPPKLAGRAPKAAGKRRVG